MEERHRRSLAYSIDDVGSGQRKMHPVVQVLRPATGNNKNIRNPLCDPADGHQYRKSSIDQVCKEEVIIQFTHLTFRDKPYLLAISMRSYEPQI
eukprot:scaffold217_cov79-Skeletonema_dohrnii-CCMP3373.AAC.1